MRVGTNDLSLNKSPKEISEDIVTLTESMKTENNKIWAEKDIAIITLSNINPKRHLNKSRLHLIDAGISVLVSNFKAFLTNLD